MQTIDLKGVKREGTGKKVAKLLRQDELVPCVLYGAGEVVHFAANIKEFTNLVYSPNVYIVNLNIDITNLGLGKGFKVGELNYNNIEILNAKNAVVVSVKLTRAARAAAQGQK